MKIIFLVAAVLATAAASWEPVQQKFHGPLHYPKIYKGVPIEPAAVQHAREAHLKALSYAAENHYDHGYEHHEHGDHHGSGHKWHGPLHYPKIYKGVPIEPKEVQHAREAHLNALAHASRDNHHYQHDHDDHHYSNDHEYKYEKKWNGPLHYPKIYKGVPVEPKEVQHAREAHLNALSHASHHGHYDHHYYESHDGKPLDTYEVEAAKAKHFTAYHDSLAQSTQHYRKRRGASSYVHFTSKVEHEVPVYHHEDKMMANEHAHAHQSYNHGDSYGYSIKQIHAPVYGHQEDNHEDDDSYVHIHSPVYGHREEHKIHSYSPMPVQKYEHVSVIGHNGAPIDTPEVQLAKQAHFAAHAAAAKLNHY